MVITWRTHGMGWGPLGDKTILSPKAEGRKGEVIPVKPKEKLLVLIRNNIEASDVTSVSFPEVLWCISPKGNSKFLSSACVTCYMSTLQSASKRESETLSGFETTL